MEQKRILRIVVASPSDVQAERDALPAVFDELNRGIAAERDLLLELHRWETNAYPGFHPEGPQGLIDPILKIEDCDVLIGIFWKRFGTPTKDAQSGTEHEFHHAYEAWQRNRRPQIMVYFNQKVYSPELEDEREQWSRVLDFKRRFPAEGLWWEYKGKAQFERLVRNHLTQFIRHQCPPHLSAQAGAEFRPARDESGSNATPRNHPASDRARTLKRVALVVSVCALLAALGFVSLWPWRGLDNGDPAPGEPAVTWAYQRTLVGHMDAIYSNTFSPDGQTVVGGSYDGTIILWDAQTGVSRRTLPMSNKSLVYMVALSPSGDHVAAGVGNDVLLGNIETEERPRAFKGHTGFAFAVAFAPGGGMLASGSADHTIRIWDVQTAQTIRTLAEHRDEVNAVAFSADGKLLASGSYDRTIIIWDAATWAVKARLTGHDGHVYSVAFASDGRTLASGGEDKTVRLWDVHSGTLKQTLYQHQGAVNSIAFAPDGGTVASAGNDGVVLIWDARTGRVRQTLRRHTAAVNSVAFAPDGRTLASGSKDKTVVLWGIQAGGTVPIATRPDAP